MPSRLVRFLMYLRRRRVFRATVAHIVGTWLLLQIFGVGFVAFGIPETALRFVLFAAILGYPVTIFFIWRYEVSAKGITRASPKSGGRSDMSDLSLNRSDYFTITALLVVVVIIGLGMFRKVVELPSQSTVREFVQAAPVNSVAVLPFVNMSDDPGNEYFSDGITEELLDRLAKLEELSVAARTSSFFFKGKDLPISEIAAKLGVRNIVEGSVRKSGNSVRITAQLIDADRGFHLWSQTYDRELTDIFAIQDELANSIVHELSNLLGAGQSIAPAHPYTPTENIDAYDLFLQGQHQLLLRGEQAIRRSIDLFTKAITMDPEFARAYESIATAYAILPEYTDESAIEAYAVATAHATRAIELEPSAGGPHGVLGYMNMRRWRWKIAAPQFKRALELDKNNATINQWHSNYLNDVLFGADALIAAQQAHKIDRASPAVNVVLAFNYVLSGSEYNELALKHSAAAKEYGYAGLFDDHMSFVVRLRRGEFEQAAKKLVRAYQEAGKDSSWIERFTDAMQDPDKIPQALEALKSAQSDGTATDGDLFFRYALLGQPDGFFALAANHIDDQRLPYVYTLLPEAGRIRSDPRFAGLLEKIHLIEFWRENGWPPVCQPLADSVRCQ
ncbi:MAG: hypothetical protein O6844_00245 [Gammaproteobacteria bacterium]|nr:hypothetical protein [Gammaproteobacteria bacterium]MCZ6826424.1 hypothetical protein [Gammaproteobacteria bacterium]MCZ6911583.1 hypothetical protein [Pseudomonadota bacterium]